MHDEIVADFLATMKDVLEHRNGVVSWGKAVDEQVALFIHGIGAACSHSTLTFQLIVP